MWAEMQKQRTWDRNARINNVRQKVQEMNMGPKKGSRINMRLNKKNRKNVRPKKKQKDRNNFKPKATEKNVRLKPREQEEWQAKIKRAGKMPG